jgi:hypothetical protein
MIDLPERIKDVFVVNITQYCENIPIEGKDNLIFAVFFIKNIF